MNQKNLNLSAVVIARNEAVRIRQCLDSLSWVDEIVVIDNNSQDQTGTIAKSLGAQVFTTDKTSFADLRNLGKEKATHAWILYVDADELITEKLAREIKKIVKNYHSDSDPAGYFLTRKNYYLGHAWPVADRMQRLFWKEALTGWSGEVHETALIKGNFGVIKEPLIHHTHRTLEEMVAKTNEWSEIEAKLRLNAKHPPIVAWRLLHVMWIGFANSFFKQGGWRAGVIGWIESIYQGFSMFITYAKLWEKQQK